MGSYLVTISPEEAGGAQASVRVEVVDGVARITELVVRPSMAREPDDPALGVDFDALMRAVQPAIAAIESVGAGRPAPEPTRPARTTPARTTPQRTTPARPTPERSTARRTSASAGRNHPGAAAVDAAAMRPRAYRRIPEDVVDVYAQLGSVTRLAEHYGVPRHTAQGWINRVRRDVAE